MFCSCFSPTDTVSAVKGNVKVVVPAFRSVACSSKAVCASVSTLLLHPHVNLLLTSSQQLLRPSGIFGSNKPRSVRVTLNDIANGVSNGSDASDAESSEQHKHKQQSINASSLVAPPSYSSPSSSSSGAAAGAGTVQSHQARLEGGESEVAADAVVGLVVRLVKSLRVHIEATTMHSLSLPPLLREVVHVGKFFVLRYLSAVEKVVTVEK